MKISLLLTLVHGLQWSNAFVNTIAKSKQVHNNHKKLLLQNSRSSDDNNSILGNAKQSFLSIGAAATIAAASISAGEVMFGAPLPANGVEISSGSFVIETSTKGEAFFNAQLETKTIVNTIFKNRKALANSFDHIRTAILDEMKSPAIMELGKEIVQFEGDVAPEVQISAPANWQQTIRDIQRGKLNFVFNGELINISVEPSFSDSEDDLVIRVVGFKGVDLTKNLHTDEVENAEPNFIGDNWKAFWEFWHSPLPEPYSKYLPEGVQMDTGGAILSGTGLGIVAAYILSYNYYLYEIETAEAEAAAKQAEMKEKRALATKKAAQAKTRVAKDTGAAEEEAKESAESEADGEPPKKSRRFPWQRN